MSLELNFVEVPTYKKADASSTFVAEAGKIVKIETSPDGEELMNLEVPVGKQWEVTISVHIHEENV